MSLLTIGEFAHRTRLSVKALRLYDQLGLVTPAMVDASSGYRLYSAGQVENARLVGLLRRIGMPLAEISALLALPPASAAAAVTAFGARQETIASGRRELVRYLTGQLSGQEPAMYQIDVHSIPERKLLTMTRHVHIDAMEAFVEEARARLLTAAPRLPGHEGAPFITYYGEVSDDSDGPVEFSRPVAADTSEDILAGLPGAELRTEPAHEDASVRIKPGLSWAQTLPALDALTRWISEHQREPRPGIRQVAITDLTAQPPELLALDLTVSLR
jgi:DNA-binding transcriptional MerR regulator